MLLASVVCIASHIIVRSTVLNASIDVQTTPTII